MTEAEARALLVQAAHAHLDAWMAAQPWQSIADGWRVVPALQGWRFRVEVAGAGQLRITGALPDSAPTVWIVAAQAVLTEARRPWWRTLVRE